MTVWVRQQSFFMHKRSRLLLDFMLLLATGFALFSVFNQPANAQSASNKTIHFSARLKGSGGAATPDGLYNVGFRLYMTNENGQAIWSENYYDENGVSAGQDYRVKVTNGYLSVKLGSRKAFPTSINWENGLWLTMNIGGTTQTSVVTSIPWDGEMSPRIELGAVPYAMSAGSLGGKTAGDFVQLGQGAQTNNSDNPSIQINTTGSGDLIQLEKNGDDVFSVTNQGDIEFGSGSDHTIAIANADPNNDGQTLAISGGDGGEGDTNGGNLVLSGGAGSGTGANGTVVLATTTFATATNDSNCYLNGTVVATSCTLTQTTVDSSSAVMVGFSTEGQSAQLPDPTVATPGRILYIMAANNSLPFSLIVNGDESLAMKSKTALTLLWNGSDWVVAGHTGSNNSGPQAPEIVDDGDMEDDMIIENGTSEETITVDPGEPLQPEQDTSQSPAPAPQGNSFPFQLGQSESAPLASPGTMYYDTSLGKVQCYEASGWGSCGDAPDTFVTISPEYKNAVMNGTDVGIISSDFCSGTLGINDGSKSQPTVCAPDETFNFYKWTSEEDDSQTRSIYLTYQLPDNFKGFIEGSSSIMGRTDSSDSSVNYQIYRDDGNGLTSCGTAIDVSTGFQSKWQGGLAVNESDPAACEFEPGDSILFRINLSAKKSANAYVSNVNFIFRNS